MIRLHFKHLIASVVIAAVVAGCNESGTSTDGAGVSSVAQGQRGSTARMALIDDFLYAISGDVIQLFNVEGGQNPELWTSVQLDFGIETLFPYGNFLLVGADNGVFILDNSDRAAPLLIGEFTHATAIDPVVARDDIAYVTLSRDPAEFPNENTDRMDVVDISNPANPVLIHTVDMQGPRGLAIDGDLLHVCDSEGGIKTFTLENPREPTLEFVLPNDRCIDMILTDDILITISENDISQYDVTTGRPMKISEMRREAVIYLLDP